MSEVKIDLPEWVQEFTEDFREQIAKLLDLKPAPVDEEPAPLRYWRDSEHDIWTDRGDGYLEFDGDVTAHRADVDKEYGPLAEVDRYGDPVVGPEPDEPSLSEQLWEEDRKRDERIFALEKNLAAVSDRLGRVELLEERLERLERALALALGAKSPFQWPPQPATWPDNPPFRGGMRVTSKDDPQVTINYRSTNGKQ